MTGAAERAAAAGSSPPPAPGDREARGDEVTAAAPESPPQTAATEAADAAAPPPERVVVPRWVQLVLLPLGLLALWAIARASGKVLLLFIVAGVIALILNPAVSFLQRDHGGENLLLVLHNKHIGLQHAFDGADNFMRC